MPHLVNVVDVVAATSSSLYDRGTMFRALRLGAGVSTRTVAERAGISHSTLSRWERGQRELAEETYARLTDALSALMLEAETAA